MCGPFGRIAPLMERMVFTMAEDKIIPVEQEADQNGNGSIRISNEVVATIAGLAAAEVPGLAGMSGGGLSDLLGRKNLTKGVKVDIGEKEVSIDLYVIIEFGTLIPAVAEAVQNKVKSAVENMTGLKVTTVDVHVQGVTFPQGHPAGTTSEE